ncbi:hypothetical protein ACH5RR_012493 [Cinchona calisaya]|uniref:Uncharacterized protein n=1 Tax=Cinchona calisaya TaxID=153742 RepID=A0ABD3ABH7_9GENT
MKGISFWTGDRLGNMTELSSQNSCRPPRVSSQSTSSFGGSQSIGVNLYKNCVGWAVQNVVSLHKLSILKVCMDAFEFDKVGGEGGCSKVDIKQGEEHIRAEVLKQNKRPEFKERLESILEQQKGFHSTRCSVLKEIQGIKFVAREGEGIHTVASNVNRKTKKNCKGNVSLKRETPTKIVTRMPRNPIGCNGVPNVLERLTMMLMFGCQVITERFFEIYSSSLHNAAYISECEKILMIFMFHVNGSDDCGSYMVKYLVFLEDERSVDFAEVKKLLNHIPLNIRHEFRVAGHVIEGEASATKLEGVELTEKDADSEPLLDHRVDLQVLCKWHDREIVKMEKRLEKFHKIRNMVVKCEISDYVIDDILEDPDLAYDLDLKDYPESEDDDFVIYLPSAVCRNAKPYCCSVCGN